MQENWKLKKSILLQSFSKKVCDHTSVDLAGYFSEFNELTWKSLKFSGFTLKFYEFRRIFPKFTRNSTNFKVFNEITRISFGIVQSICLGIVEKEFWRNSTIGILWKSNIPHFEIRYYPLRISVLILDQSSMPHQINVSTTSRHWIDGKTYKVFTSHWYFLGKVLRTRNAKTKDFLAPFLIAFFASFVIFHFARYSAYDTACERNHRLCNRKF